VGLELLLLLIPVAMLVAYDLAARKLYGHSLLLDAAEYAGEEGFWDWEKRRRNVYSVFAFTGAGVVILVTLAPALLRITRWMAAGALTVILVLGVLVNFAILRVIVPETPIDLQSSQIVLWALVGEAVLVVVIYDLFRTSSPQSFVLMLWILGTLVFAGLVNWTVNARSILPLVPAVGILIARQVDRRYPRPTRRLIPWLAGGLAAATALSLIVAWADSGMAGSAREAVKRIVHWRHTESRNPAANIWFHGHWGFQYSAQEAGWIPMAVGPPQPGTPRPTLGDIMVVPGFNTNMIVPPQLEKLTPTEVVTVPVPAWITTLNAEWSASFYGGGPMLPFRFTRVGEQRYSLYY
jgi:hypothetical protein